MKFDVIVDDSPTSPNQKERTFQVLMQMMPMAVQAGVKVPPEILDFAPLPENLIQSWKKMLIPDPKKVQEAKQKEAQEAQTMRAMAMAEVEKDKAEKARQGSLDVPKTRQIHRGAVSKERIPLDTFHSCRVNGRVPQIDLG